MMSSNNRNGGPSRPGSSRPASMARDIIKKHHNRKPFKATSTNKKLHLRRTMQQAPPGYTYMPVGVSELSDRCKELSRQRGFPVNSVNSRPRSNFAADPGKVSHYITRIGYNFRSEIVEEACAELGYILQYRKFIKESELRERNQKKQAADIAAKFGLKVDLSKQEDTKAQARAAIREMFPRVPSDDLEAIVQHAWEEGTHRVGTAPNVELARRVQLAVLARIRHHYTDYDALLKALGNWHQVRLEVEPVTLRKLKEWMPEDADESELQRVKQTIVIDSDDDSSDDSDETDSAADLSDASFEVQQLDEEDDFEQTSRLATEHILSGRNGYEPVREEHIPVFVNASRENVPEKVLVDGKWYYNQAYHKVSDHGRISQGYHSGMPVYGAGMPVHGAPAPVQYSYRHQ